MHKQTRKNIELIFYVFYLFARASKREFVLDGVSERTSRGSVVPSYNALSDKSAQSYFRTPSVVNMLKQSAATTVSATLALPNGICYMLFWRWYFHGFLRFFFIYIFNKVTKLPKKEDFSITKYVTIIYFSSEFNLS